jgi:hypothetical protein
LRVYNDNAQNIAALTNSLRATYAPEPGAFTLLGVAGAGFVGARRRRRTARR